MDPSPASPPASSRDAELAEPEPSPIGRGGQAFLTLAGMVALVGIVAAFFAVAFLLGGNTVVTVLLLFAGGLAGLYVFARIAAYGKRRSAAADPFTAVDAWASSLGLDAVEDPSVTVPVAAAPFDHAGRHTALRSWRGRHAGQAVTVLHYLVDTGTSGSPERRLYTVVAATGNGDLPTTEAVPQQGVAAVAARLGRDLDVESAAFNRAWRVFSADERATHALLTPRVIERLVDAAEDPVRTVWSGTVVVTVESGAVMDTDVLARRLDYVTDLAALVPGFARSDGGRSGAPAAEDARADVVAHRRRERSGTELVLLLIGLASLFGGIKVMRDVAFVPGTSLLLLGIAIGTWSTPVAAWIDRRRAR